MSQFMHTVRFFVGMAMLAGGVALAQPFVAAVVAAREQATASGPSAAVPGMQPGPRAMAIGTGGHAIPDPRPVDSLGGPGLPLPAGDQFLSAPTPPSPPTPLPASGLDSSPAAPALDGTYRSTVEIPPPPLLDFHAPRRSQQAGLRTTLPSRRLTARPFSLRQCPRTTLCATGMISLNSP